MPVDGGGGALVVQGIAEDCQTFGTGRLAGVIHVVAFEVLLLLLKER